MAGRRKTYDRKLIARAFERYIAETEIPIAAEFAASVGCSKYHIYDTEDYADLLAHCFSKKEAALERLCLAGKINPAMAIFSLKQMGWSDRHETTVKGDKAHPLQIMNTDARL